MKEALILFSGGKDSFLSTLLTIESGYKVNLVTFDNGCSLKSNNVLTGAKRIQKKYGQDKVNIIGIKKTDPIWRDLIYHFYNYDTKFILEEFGKITISQFNCLSCRLAMYISAIIICKQRNINLIIDGARKSQLFALEQEKLLEKFKHLFKEYDLTIEFPLRDTKDDYEIKNKILSKGFIPKMNESQCLLGMPITNNSMNEDILDGCYNVYQKELYPKIAEILKKYEKDEPVGEYL